MFHTPHARSGSDASLHQSYEPQGPSVLTPSPSPAPYLYTRQETNRSQPTNMSSSSSAPPDTTRLSPERSQSPERNLTPSPKPSYYSASEIRPPSPPPQPVYRFTTGEYTSTPPSGRQSVASRHTRGSFDVFRSPLPPPATTVPNAAQLSDALRVAGTAAGPTQGAYEMQVRSRSPPSALAYRSAQETRGVSEASYATAQDTWSEDFDDDRPANGYDNDTATVQPDYDTRRASSYSWDGGRAL
jgi:phospholipid-translocating ATPase